MTAGFLGGAQTSRSNNGCVSAVAMVAPLCWPFLCAGWLTYSTDLNWLNTAWPYANYGSGIVMALSGVGGVTGRRTPSGSV